MGRVRVFVELTQNFFQEGFSTRQLRGEPPLHSVLYNYCIQFYINLPPSVHDLFEFESHRTRSHKPPQTLIQETIRIELRPQEYFLILRKSAPRGNDEKTGSDGIPLWYV